VEDLYLQGQRESFAFLLDMNVLFERYIARLLETSCIGRGISVDV
jgi:5-methylcytosine-specific restriction endonuclease McrBC regulatory subunit McrC